jgi:hypothetical protein
MTLRFGKYKGQQFENTPKPYQKWLLSQDWFKVPKQEKPLRQQLNGWDGYSGKGQSIYDAIFEQEKEQGDMLDTMSGMYEKGGMYYEI